MKIDFYKYQGTGNDFIMINNMNQMVELSPAVIQSLCDRKLGIGADGIILIEPDNQADFYVNYFNSDGSQSFCGNGSRCSVAFSAAQGVFSGFSCSFQAIDGFHTGELHDENQVTVSMRDVTGIERLGEDAVLDTGSPHYVKYCNALKTLPLIEEAHKIRYSDRFSKEGINVNFIELFDSQITMRTYERGVEDETLSCGTGVTAVALFSATTNGTQSKTISTKGGDLEVQFHKDLDRFTEIKLKGEANLVFSGKIEIE